MQKTFSDAKNKIEFISEFQKGFYTMCKRIDPGDPVEFVITQLSRIFYATHKISGMKKFGEEYLKTNSYYEFTIYDFERDISFTYSLANYIDTGSYSNGFAFDCEIGLKDLETPKEFMISEMFDGRGYAVYDEDFDTKDRVFYVVIHNEEEADLLYFPIKVSKRQATMNLYGLSKMISLAALFSLQIIYIVSEISDGFSIPKKEFYRLVFEMNDIANHDPRSLTGFKAWLDETDINGIIKYKLPSLDGSFLYKDLDHEKNKEIVFSTLSDQKEKDDSDNNDWSTKKRHTTKKPGTTVAVKLPNNMEDSPLSEISRFLGNLLGIDLNENDIDMGDGEDNKTESRDLSFDDIIKFIDSTDNIVSFIDLPISGMKGIIKAMRTFLMIPREDRKVISSHSELEAIYESSTVVCLRTAKSELDTCTFIISGKGGKYTMSKCTVPVNTNRTASSYPMIGIALNGVGALVEVKKFNMQKALNDIADIEDFHDDCIRLFIAFFGSHITKKANVTNPYSGADKDNNIIIQNANFTSVMDAFEKVDCFNNEDEIDAAIRLIRKETRRHEFICPWMKEIKDVENRPVIVDTDGMAYAYEDNAREFTQLIHERVEPSSPFHTDMSFHISKGGKSITAKGPYLSTDGFKMDIVSIFNYLKQLKKMD